MASLRRFLHRDTPPPASWQPDETLRLEPHMRTRARRDGPQFALEAANNEQGTAIPVPTAHASRASRASSNVRVDARPRLRPHPRRTATIWRVQSCVYGGYLEKQSSENPKLWKKRWFVMQESKLFYYKSQGDVKEQKPTDDTCCGVISMENIDSVTTADFGVAAFQIRMESRRYVLRAESKDMMHEWLFNFQKSIANIVSALSRTQAFATRTLMESMRDLLTFERICLGGFLASTSFSDESTGGDGSSSSRTSPRRASSPLAFGGFGPRSPLMFAFDPMDDVPEHHTPPVRQSSIAETKEESIDHDGQLHLGGRWEENENTETTTEAHQLFRRRRPRSQQARACTCSYCWSLVPRHQREGFAEMQPIESFSINTRDSFHETFNEDSSSYSTGDDVHGVTSLLGVRSAMEDVCCCIPDLNAHLKDDQPHHQRQSFYALFDGHSGVRAATFSNQRLVSYLTSHEAFMSDTRLAFEECFARSTENFCKRLTRSSCGVDSGNRLITANIGDCRAVVSIGGQALDIIEEQTPGRPDERERIEKQGGWVKEERELQLSKLHSMDLSDPEIQQRAERVVKWVTIYRVNGSWLCLAPLAILTIRARHCRSMSTGPFLRDTTECFMEIEITPEFDFLILACDGLWDTIKSKEAVKYVADRLNEGYSAKQASQSLANLAIRSGSSDNVSVVIVMLNTEQMSSSIDAFSRQ
ncbi:Protein phosphatase 2C family [Phytophthora cactorum]|nr:Protein phosphatase 2C family [Phytophthora cactorum]